MRVEAQAGRVLHDTGVVNVFYGGPHQPRLELSSWGQVVAAAAAGFLDETQWVELKKDVGAGKAGQLELARDLASLSVCGGLLSSVPTTAAP